MYLLFPILLCLLLVQCSHSSLLPFFPNNVIMYACLNYLYLFWKTVQRKTSANLTAYLSKNDSCIGQHSEPEGDSENSALIRAVNVERHNLEVKYKIASLLTARLLLYLAIVWSVHYLWLMEAKLLLSSWLRSGC